MNNPEFSTGSWTLTQEMALMCKCSRIRLAHINPSPVSLSLGLVTLVYTLAFNSFVREMLLLIVSLTWTKFITITGLYARWMEFPHHGDEVVSMRMAKTRKWKQEAIFAKQRARQRRTDELVKKIAEREMRERGLGDEISV